MARYGKFTGVISALAFNAAPAGAAELDGEIAFNNHCRKCHSIKQGDNRLAPSLHAIVGAKGSEVAGYAGYSGALKGITWDEATLDKFIAAPASVAPSTTMLNAYSPVQDAAERKAIIEFLKKGAAP